MDFKEFCTELIMNVYNRTGAEVTVEEIVKNNDTILHGLVIKGDNNFAPTIYLDNFFKAGINVEETADRVISMLDSAPSIDFDVNSISDFSKVKDKIVPKLINRDMNQKLLENAAHQPFLDLEVIYQIKVFSNGNETGTVTIKNEFLENWGEYHSRRAP